jgi:chromosome segregation ATPase
VQVRLVVAGFVLACSLPGPASAQAQPAPDGATLDPVAREIRLLRQTLERQAAATARAQLIVARLTLYDQRASRARAALDRLEAEASSAERERGQLQAALRENARALEQAGDPDRRQELGSQSRMLRAQTIEVDAQLTKIEARLAAARQALDVETERYDELERWLNELDRQLQSGR